MSRPEKVYKIIVWVLIVDTTIIKVIDEIMIGRYLFLNYNLNYFYLKVIYLDNRHYIMRICCLSKISFAQQCNFN